MGTLRALGTGRGSRQEVIGLRQGGMAEGACRPAFLLRSCRRRWDVFCTGDGGNRRTVKKLPSVEVGSGYNILIGVQHRLGAFFVIIHKNFRGKFRNYRL